MKLFFFLIAFCLIFLRVFITGPWYEKRGKNDVTISIGNGDDYEQVRYGGKITLTDDETGIKSISPGGYIKYRKNDKKLIAVSNLEGDINYTITDDGQVLPGEKGKKFITEAVKEMIAYGFDAPARMDRIYAKGGGPALLNELDSLKSSGVISMYIDHLLIDDSLGQYTTSLIKKIGLLGSDHDKVVFLNKLTGTQLKNPQTVQAYFDIVQHFGSDMDKVNMLGRWTSADTMQQDVFPRILEITAHLGSDHDKVILLNKITGSVLKDSQAVRPYFEIVEHLGSDMDKVNMLGLWTREDSIPEGIFNKIADITIHLGSDMDKENMFKQLINKRGVNEDGWISIINATAGLGSDFEKSNVLVLIAQKMPGSENIKTAYRKAAKTIGNDGEYGKAIKAID